MSSLVTAPERSLIGKITRSGLDTRKWRPPASTILASDTAMPGVLRQRRPGAHRHGTAAASHDSGALACSNSFERSASPAGLPRRTARGRVPAIGRTPQTPRHQDRAAAGGKSRWRWVARQQGRAEAWASRFDAREGLKPWPSAALNAWIPFLFEQRSGVNTSLDSR